MTGINENNTKNNKWNSNDKKKNNHNKITNDKRIIKMKKTQKIVIKIKINIPKIQA